MAFLSHEASQSAIRAYVSILRGLIPKSPVNVKKLLSGSTISRERTVSSTGER